jgi:ribosome biogenesis GTPase
MIECRARGKFRKDKVTPLVGDRVCFEETQPGKGVVTQLLERKNFFIRPPIANIDYLVIIASAVIPVTDPYLIDRMTATAKSSECKCIICLNKCDMDRADKLYDIYSRSGFITVRTSAKTGEGINELRELIAGKQCAFTGNSGVGKSSILNALMPGLDIATGNVSAKLGRGRHTTRHVELFALPNGAVIADTPGFSAFDTEKMELVFKQRLQYYFEEFEPYLDTCMFANCSHTREKGCSILKAVQDGHIQPSRHSSYVRMYEQAKQINEWEYKKNK